MLVKNQSGTGAWLGHNVMTCTTYVVQYEQTRSLSALTLNWVRALFIMKEIYMLRQDKEQVLGHSLIQHGDLNDRVYVMDYKYALDPYLINQVQLLAKDFDYGKIIAKVPKEARPKFTRQNYELEAIIPKFFNGKKPCLFMAKYNKEKRKKVANIDEIENVLEEVESKESHKLQGLKNDYHTRVLMEKDVEKMASIYKKVFKTYPFPIHDPKYLEKTMEDETVYFGVFNKEELIGISSCEINSNEENVEMTDFAILPKYRGKQLANHLIRKMEQAMKEMGIKTAYTIARSISFPMNAAFAGAGYIYSGTLWNNTQISGNIESMNVWYKPLYR